MNRAGAKAQQLQELSAFPEDPSSVPRNHKELFVAPVPEDPIPSSSLPIYVAYINIFFLNLKKSLKGRGRGF